MSVENTSKNSMTIQSTSPFQRILEQHGFFLRSFNQKNKWQLWLSERPMLKRSWVNVVGLDKKKVVHLSNNKYQTLIAIIEKALSSRTCSYIVACISNLSDIDKKRLTQASIAAKTFLFIIDEQTNNDSLSHIYH